MKSFILFLLEGYVINICWLIVVIWKSFLRFLRFNFIIRKTGIVILRYCYGE